MLNEFINQIVTGQNKNIYQKKKIKKNHSSSIMYIYENTDSKPDSTASARPVAFVALTTLEDIPLAAK